MFQRIEQRVLGHDSGSNGEIEVTAAQAQRLIASGHYRPSSGQPHGAEHHRRGLPDGSCLHLVWEEHRLRLHHDAFNPHAGPLSLAFHVTHEARNEAVAIGAWAWLVLKHLAR